MNLVARKSIQDLEDKMRSMPERIEIEPIHHFANGMYAREVRIPAGTTVTSKIHKTEHFAVIAKGSATVVTEEVRQFVEAPLVMLTKPGTKRAVYVHSDMVWVTFHRTDLTDLNEIERELIALDYDALEMETHKCLG